MGHDAPPVNHHPVQDSEDVHDWVQPLLYSELFGMMQFFQQNGDPHSLVSGSGYLAKLKYSVTYQRELQTLEGAMRESFERLPICEIPKHWSSELMDCFSCKCSNHRMRCC